MTGLAIFSSKNRYVVYIFDFVFKKTWYSNIYLFTSLKKLIFYVVIKSNFFR